MQRRMLAILFQSKRAIRDDECLEMNKLAPKDTRAVACCRHEAFERNACWKMAIPLSEIVSIDIHQGE